MTPKRKKIIIVDDNPTNLTACKNVLKPYYEVYPAPSAAKMFTLLDNFLPELILMDVEMPGIDGYEAAKMLRGNSATSGVPFIFLSARRDADSELEGLELGALDYIFKPVAAQLLLRRIDSHLALLERRNELEALNASMQRMVMEKTNQLWKLQSAVLSIIAELVEYRDAATGGHINRTQKYLRCLIGELLEQGVYSDDIASWDLDSVLPSAQLHDLGKIAISDAILNKPGKLSPEEFDEIKTHPAIGVDAIRRMEQVTDDHEFFRHAKIFAGTHHEKWDGSGYPEGLMGCDIPLEGRLLAIADVYDALISVRPYKGAMSHEEACAIIEAGRGTHFDPRLVDMFLKVADQFKAIAEEESNERA